MSMIGQRFAYRERMRAYGEPMRPVEMTNERLPRSNKVRVRWLDGEYEGLEEWVPKSGCLRHGKKPKPSLRTSAGCSRRSRSPRKMTATK
jgi:hypothetical protein